jgi:hypothetical protein
MTPDQIPQLLAQIALADPRVRREDPIEMRAQIHMWAGILTDVPYDAAVRYAQEHYAKSQWPILPADIAARWQTEVRDRMNRHADPAPPVDPDDWQAYTEQLRAHRTAVALGHTAPVEVRQLTSGGPADGDVTATVSRIGRYMPEQFDQWRPNRRGRLTTTGADPLSVPCPWDACRAPTGQPCRIGRRERTTPHPSRVETATSQQQRETA